MAVQDRAWTHLQTLGRSCVRRTAGSGSTGPTYKIRTTAQTGWWFDPSEKYESHLGCFNIHQTFRFQYCTYTCTMPEHEYKTAWIKRVLAHEEPHVVLPLPVPEVCKSHCMLFYITHITILGQYIHYQSLSAIVMVANIYSAYKTRGHLECG